MGNQLITVWDTFPTKEFNLLRIMIKLLAHITKAKSEEKHLKIYLPPYKGKYDTRIELMWVKVVLPGFPVDFRAYKGIPLPDNAIK